MFYWNETETSNFVVEGKPIDAQKNTEYKLWSRFKGALKKLSRGKLGIGIGVDGVSFEAEIERSKEDAGFHKAQINKMNAETNRFVAETVEIQARLEENPIKKALVINEELRKIFSDDKIPEEIKYLELAVLMEADSTIAEQMKKISSLYQSLKLLRRVNVSIIDTE